MAGERSSEMRRLASECLASARQTSDTLVRASRLDMAQKWIDLAELSENDPWNDALRQRVIQAAIGRKLRDLCKTSLDVPHHMLTILMQLNANQPASLEEARSPSLDGGFPVLRTKPFAAANNLIQAPAISSNTARCSSDIVIAKR
jgi:hypothetical protein